MVNIWRPVKSWPGRRVKPGSDRQPALPRLWRVAGAELLLSWQTGPLVLTAVSALGGTWGREGSYRQEVRWEYLHVFLLQPCHVVSLV